MLIVNGYKNQRKLVGFRANLNAFWQLKAISIEIHLI